MVYKLINVYERGYSSIMTDTLNLMKLDSKIWHNQIAKLLIAQNTPDFTKVMLETLKCVVTFDHSVIFAFHGRERPHCLFETFTPRQRIVMVADYQEGPYLLDPFFIACQEIIFVYFSYFWWT